MAWSRRYNTPAVQDMTLDDLQRGYESRRFTCSDLVRVQLACIREVNDKAKAVAEIDPTATEQAEVLDLERATGKIRGPLHGATILLKNQIATYNLNNTCGSTALLGAKTGRDAAVVKKLRDSGIVIMGKANMTQWGSNRDPEQGNGWSADAGQALGVYFENQDPWGSSSGSATGTALGLAFAALGTEVEGSIICAAERSNLCGLKPTVGLVTRDLVMVSPRLGSVGTLTRCVKDAAEILTAIAGPCKLDPGTRNIPFSTVPDYAASCQAGGLRQARIGVPTNALRGSPPMAELLPVVKEAFNRALRILQSCGAIIIHDTDFTEFDEVLKSKSPDVVKSSDFKHMITEYFGNLVENPSGIRNAADLVRYTQDDPREAYPSRPTRGLEKAAMAMEERESEAFAAAVEYTQYLADEGGVGGALRRHAVDVLILPTCVAPMVPALGGYPMISVPLGFYPEGTEVKWNVRHDLVQCAPGLPFGLTFIGGLFSEEKLIKFAYAFEHATQVWRQQRPRINISGCLSP
ncbi:glutamyl-tRNA amidotransferase subunit A [Lasiosphaeria hispida]|uniref:Glutamyl-tRNA amidotransferase subunit A n=1 Tax=Lasiosphaeria hispida TaxID=260671 RepID=A0AAJ0HL41_9PEZI|nr:glutamyl-tRNA amidotransferase subunit A [Lasiosphaeria hispida]